MSEVTEVNQRHEDYDVRRRVLCRVCDGELNNVFSLGAHYLNSFRFPGESPGIKVPLEIVVCRKCQLVQQRYTVSPNLLYRDRYWYRSGTTATMRAVLRRVAEEATSRVGGLQTGDMVVDIGSNDGTLLRFYSSSPPIQRVGFEPSVTFKESGKEGIDVLINRPWNADLLRHEFGNKNAKIITALGMFYDLEEPLLFLQDVARVLRDDGVFVLQLMCLRNTLSQNDLGNLCHEHLVFYGLRHLEEMVRGVGMEIYEGEKNNVNGESYLLWIRKKKAKIAAPYLHDLADYERHEELIPDLNKFWERCRENRLRVREQIRYWNNQGHVVYAYGASTKGNTLLQYWNLGPDEIAGVLDRDSEKHDRLDRKSVV